MIDLRDFTFEWAVVEDEHVRAAGELVVENISPERNANLPSGEGTGRMEGSRRRHRVHGARGPRA